MSLAKKVNNWIKKTILFQWLVKLLRSIKPPGFEGMSLYDLIAFLIESFREGNYSTRGAAISFYMILAVFPLLLVLLALIPYVPIDGFQIDVINEIKLMLPETMHEQVMPVLEDLILEKHYVVLSIGFVLTIYYASNSIDAILKSFNSSYQIDSKRHPLKRRFISLMISIIWAIFSLGAIILMISGEHLIFEAQAYFEGNEKLFSFLAHGVKWIVVFLMLIIGITILYNFGNPEIKKFKLFSAGSSLAALIIILASVGFITYATNFGSYNELYGSVGSLIVLLLWMNLCSRILLIGFELTTKVETIKTRLQKESEAIGGKGLFDN